MESTKSRTGSNVGQSTRSLLKLQSVTTITNKKIMRRTKTPIICFIPPLILLFGGTLLKKHALRDTLSANILSAPGAFV